MEPVAINVVDDNVPEDDDPTTAGGDAGPGTNPTLSSPFFLPVTLSTLTFLLRSVKIEDVTAQGQADNEETPYHDPALKSIREKDLFNRPDLRIFNGHTRTGRSPCLSRSQALEGAYINARSVDVLPTP